MLGYILTSTVSFIAGAALTLWTCHVLSDGEEAYYENQIWGDD